jgi:hypothetical protein
MDFVAYRVRVAPGQTARAALIEQLANDRIVLPHTFQTLFGTQELGSMDEALPNGVGQKLWLTEYALVRGAAGVTEVDALAMTREWIDLLEHNRLVTRYAHFTNRLESGNYAGYRLIGDDGALNKFGELYRGF